MGGRDTVGATPVFKRWKLQAIRNNPINLAPNLHLLDPVACPPKGRNGEVTNLQQ